MKILLDMNLSPRWVAVLENQGHLCVHWSKVGDPRAPDRVVMEWARRNKHVVVTHDLDFGAILVWSRASAPSVVQMRAQDILPSAKATLLSEVLSRYEAELDAGALITVDEAKSRVRILPLSG